MGLKGVFFPITLSSAGRAVCPCHSTGFIKLQVMLSLSLFANSAGVRGNGLSENGYTSWGRRVLGREMEKQPRRSCRSVLIRAWKPGCCCCAAPQLCFAHGKALPCCTEPVWLLGGHCWGSSAIAWQHSRPQRLRVQQLCIHIC